MGRAEYLQFESLFHFWGSDSVGNVTNSLWAGSTNRRFSDASR